MRARRDGDGLVWEDPITLHEMRVSIVDETERFLGDVLIRDEETGSCVWMRGSDIAALIAFLKEHGGNDE